MSRWLLVCDSCDLRTDVTYSTVERIADAIWLHRSLAHAGACEVRVEREGGGGTIAERYIQDQVERIERSFQRWTRAHGLDG